MGPAKLGSFDRSSLKSEARRFWEKSARPPCWESPLKLQRHLVRLLAFWKQIANSSHSFVSDFLFNVYSCWQWCYEQIWKFGAMSILSQECCYTMAIWTLRNIGNGAMNTPRYWQLHDDAWQLKKFYWSSIFLSSFVASLIAFLLPVLHVTQRKEMEALFCLPK